MGNFTFENQGANTFLVYTVEDEQALDMLSLGMVINNKIEGIIPVGYMQMDHMRYLKYNISSRVSLQQYFQGMVAKKQFLNVFLSIANAMLRIEEYMILPNSMLFDMDRIYVDVSNANAELICLPLMDKNTAVDMGKFFKNIVFSIRFNQNENCDYVTKIINYLNSTDNFSLLEFRNLLQETLAESNDRSSKGSTPMPVSNPKHRGNPTYTCNSMPTIGSSQVPNVSTQMYGQPSKPMEVQPSVIHTQPMQKPSVWQGNNQNGNQNMSPNTMETSNSKKGKLWPFGKKEKKEKQKQSPKNAKRQKGNFVNQVGGYTGMQIPNSNNQTSGTMQNSNPTQSNPYAPNRASSLREVSQDSPSRLDMGNMNIPGQNRKIEQEQMIKPIGVPLPTQRPQQTSGNPPVNYKNFGETVVLNSNTTVGETTVLSESMQNTWKPYLIRRKTNEQILVSNDSFKLGKEPSYADYCILDNPAVSRSHANIITKGQDYFIVDTNSKNHTYLNQEKIQPNTEYRLTSGTRIRLADEEFEFRLQ